VCQAFQFRAHLIVQIERLNQQAQQTNNAANLKFGRRVGMKVLQIMMAKQKYNITTF
jgi:hypothetical protein